MHRTIHHIITIAIAFLLLLPQPANAQTIDDWQEQTTTYFTIIYTPGYADKAKSYAGFVDDIYEDVSVVFNHRPEPPIAIRLYPDEKRYTEVNPLAPKVEGIVAHADFRHREVAVILPATQNQTIEEQQNNVRHELTHIIAAELSDNRLNTGFQEGTAQFVEAFTSSVSVEQKIALLSQAYQQGTLLKWSELDERDTVYENPQISYPETLSVVTFLVETYGLGTYRDFLTVSARSSGYRSALQRAYKTSPANLEAAWQAWLPTYLQGGYRASGGVQYDLSHIRQLLSLGHYAEAQGELEQAITWLQSQQEQEPESEIFSSVLQEADQLLTQSKNGQQAEMLANQARSALLQAEYEQAGNLIAQARASYAAVGDTRQDKVLAAYEERVVRGLDAQANFAEASQLAKLLQFPQARTKADEAAQKFALLGNTPQLQESIKLRRSLDSQQHIAGMALIVLGIVGVAISLFGRWGSLREEEVW